MSETEMKGGDSESLTTPRTEGSLTIHTAKVSPHFSIVWTDWPGKSWQKKDSQCFDLVSTMPILTHSRELHWCELFSLNAYCIFRSGQGRLEWWICVTALAGRTPLTVRKNGKLPLLPSGNNNNNIVSFIALAISCHWKNSSLLVSFCEFFAVLHMCECVNKHHK